MIVEVVGGADEVPEVQVMDVDDLSRLSLALGAVTDDDADRVLGQAGLGRLVDADSALLDLAGLRAAAAPRATAADWDRRWDEMVAHARGEGRVSEDGATVRVDVETAASA